MSKSHLQIKAYGTIDELNSFMGVVTSKIDDPADKHFLIEIQRDLYTIMAKLAGAKVEMISLEKKVVEFEKNIDELDKQLPKLNRFILSSGTEMASWFHVLRATTRRAERDTVEFFLSKTAKTIDQDSQKMILKYLNRLSDLFFMYARKYSDGKEILT